MRSVLYALFGASFTLATAWALGALVLRKLSLSLAAIEERMLAFIAGSACLSAVVLVLCSVGLARKSVFLVVGSAAILAVTRPGAHRRGEPLPPLPRVWKWLFVMVFAVFMAVYLVRALAPEVIPDAATHRLSLMDQAHGFIRNAGNLKGSQGFELLLLYAFAFGRRPAAAVVGLGFLASLTLLLVSYGRRMGYPAVGIGAALLTCAGFLALQHDLSGAGITIVLFALYYVLRVWDQQGARELLVLAGILAGFSYAANYAAIAALPGALAFVTGKLWRKRQPVFPPARTLCVPALTFMLPWIMKDAILGFHDAGMAGTGWLMPVLPFASLASLLALSRLPRLFAALRNVAR